MGDTVLAIAVLLAVLGIFTNFFELAAAVLIEWARAFGHGREKP